jgi:hypothetical protein
MQALSFGQYLSHITSSTCIALRRRPIACSIYMLYSSVFLRSIIFFCYCFHFVDVYGEDEISANISIQPITDQPQFDISRVLPFQERSGKKQSKVQSNLCTTITPGTRNFWPLLTGGRYSEVTLCYKNWKWDPKMLVVNSGLTVSWRLKEQPCDLQFILHR